ncbi:MAG: hypothetical protein AB7U49_12910 [Hyphomicrobiaceae bacterium]
MAPTGMVLAPKADQRDKQELGTEMIDMRAPAVAAALFAASAPAVSQESFKLPPQVTPQLRAACESDVRRLCVGANPTVAKVKSCVIAKFMKLNMRCKKEIASAGLL